MHDEHRIALRAAAQALRSRARSGRQNFHRRAAGCLPAISRTRDRRRRVRCSISIVTPSGPGAKILFAKGWSCSTGSSPSARARLPRAARRAAHRQRVRRQSCLERGKGCGIAEIGRRVGSVNHAARSVDRRVADQPEICLRVHGLRQPCGEQDKDRGLGHLLGAAEHVAGLAADLPHAPATRCRARSSPPPAPHTARCSTTATPARSAARGRRRWPPSPHRAGRHCGPIRPCAHKAGSATSQAGCRAPARARPSGPARHSRPGSPPARKALRQNSPAGSWRHRCRAGCRA